MNTITHTKIAPLMVPAVTMDTSSFVVVRIASTIIKFIQIGNIQNSVFKLISFCLWK